jgi:ribosomal protein S12 methylthiotransferase accessory factor
MIFDALSYSEYYSATGKARNRDAVGSFIEFIERKLGARVIYNLRSIPLGNAKLSDIYAIASRLQEKGILISFRKEKALADEPAIRLWGSTCNDEQKTSAGGISSESDTDAFTASIAEGLERYLLNAVHDYYRNPIRKTVVEIEKCGRFIAPERFVGFSEEQRQGSQMLRLAPDTAYIWVRGTSLITKSDIYIPKQIITGNGRLALQGNDEPLIRRASSIGLATWPTRNGARLAGAYEAIEHDAYMIMWLNQLTLPRIPLDTVRHESDSLDTLIKKCERYHLKVHAVRMLTDAPAHAICVIVEDLSTSAPRFTVGLRAHRSLSHAIEKAMLEALRTRIAYRQTGIEQRKHHASVDSIGYTERIFYWGKPENAAALEFMIAGDEELRTPAAWESDTPEESFARIIAWCRSCGYECMALSLGTSAMNISPWQVEMVIIPELQPSHLTESLRHLGGTRLRSIPLKFGHQPREKPFIERPHPFH